MSDVKPVLILVVADESGSMGIKRSDVIHGFNVFLKEQQALPGECRMTLVKFNTDRTAVYSALPIASVPALTEQTYTPGGNTALLDAVAEAVRLADKDKRPEDRVLCLVITDGEENSSRETTKAQMQAIITEREGRGDWTFTYLGISPEKWADQGLITSARNAAAYDAHDPIKSFSRVSMATTSFRGGLICQTASFYGSGDPASEQPGASPAPGPWARPHP